MAIKRGVIYFVNLNTVQGREQAGKRPVLVLSIDDINSAPLVVTGVLVPKAIRLIMIIPRMYGSPLEKAGCPSKLYFFVFKFVHWTHSGF